MYACWQIHYLSRWHELAVIRKCKKFCCSKFRGLGGGGVHPLRTLPPKSVADNNMQYSLIMRKYIRLLLFLSFLFQGTFLQ